MLHMHRKPEGGTVFRRRRRCGSLEMKIHWVSIIYLPMTEHTEQNPISWTSHRKWRGRYDKGWAHSCELQGNLLLTSPKQTHANSKRKYRHNYAPRLLWFLWYTSGKLWLTARPHSIVCSLGKPGRNSRHQLLPLLWAQAAKKQDLYKICPYHLLFVIKGHLLITFTFLLILGS